MSYNVRYGLVILGRFAVQFALIMLISVVASLLLPLVGVVPHAFSVSVGVAVSVAYCFPLLREDDAYGNPTVFKRN